VTEIELGTDEPGRIESRVGYWPDRMPLLFAIRSFNTLFANRTAFISIGDLVKTASVNGVVAGGVIKCLRWWS